MKEKSNNKQTSVDYIFNQLSSENLLGLFTHDQMRRAMEILDEAKAMQQEQAQQYAEFCVRCDRENLPLLDFESFILTYKGNEQQ
jgi:hypothetical protein